MSKSKIYNIDLWEESPLTVPVIQLDSDRTIRFKILSSNEPYDLTGKTVRYFIQKEDNKVVFNDCDVVNGIVEVKLTNQALFYNGTVPMQLLIYSPTGIEKTFVIYIYISQTIVNTEVFESSNEFKGFETALKNYQEAINQAHKYSDLLNTAFINPINYKTDTNTWSEAINEAIQKSSIGDVILIPGVELDGTINLLERRTYLGKGWGNPITIKQGLHLDKVFNADSNNWFVNTSIKDLQIDCEGRAELGIYTKNWLNCFMENVRVTGASGTGIFIDSAGGEFIANTNHIINCRAYNNGGYGICIRGLDNHIFGGDYGYNYKENVFMISASSSVRNATIWCSRTENGMTIDTDVPSVQVWNNQIEGNAKHGILVKSDFNIIQGNKIYDNANIKEHYGKYSGIFFDTTKFLTGNSIIGNTIFSGLYENTGIHDRAITIGANHNYFTLLNNSVRFQGNGTIRNHDLVSGVNSSDTYDMAHNNSYCKINLTSVQKVKGDYTYQKIKFNSKAIDNEGEFDVETFSFRPKEKGEYLVSLKLVLDNVEADTGVFVELHKNDIPSSRLCSAERNVDDFSVCNASEIVSLEADTTLSFKIMATSDVTILKEAVFSTLTIKRI